MAITLSWHNCYSEGWQNEIVPEAFSHPAKFSRALIRRIYAHALERGYLQEGDTVLDPFGGVALGAADALANGLDFVGVELEQNFIDLGGCDCTGISKADWVRCFGRWKRFAHKDGRHWCPRCLAEAGLVLEGWAPALPGMEAPTISYKRNSGKIPHTEPHRYAGNLDLFAKHAKGGATAVLVQGDSRNLVEVLEGARAEGIISSPPWEQVEPQQDKAFRAPHDTTGHLKGEYGQSAGQLGNMPTGEPPQAIIASPPYDEGLGHEGKASKIELEKGYPGPQFGGYGTDPAQLGNMPTGEPPQCILSSPPYATQTVHDRCGVAPDKLTGNPPGPHSQALTMANYGDSDGQLGTMREGDAPADYAYTPGSLTPTQFDVKAVTESITFTTAPKREEAVECEWEEEGVDGIISSPPWTSTEGSHSAAKFRDPEGSAECRAEGYRSGRLKGHGASKEAILRAMQKANQSTYGTSDGQLAALPEGEPPQVDGLVSSPPYAKSISADGHGIDWTKVGPATGNRRRGEGTQHEATLRAQLKYGTDPDNLGNMKEGEPPQVDGLVASPPWESNLCRDGRGTNLKIHDQLEEKYHRRYGERSFPKETYGDSDGQLGTESGNTFWLAARAILLQCYAILAPGGVAIWVLKAFVRNKAIVDFPGQWEALCNSCGFETVEVIRAWLVEDRGAQFAFNGDLVKRKVARKSFFRRLHESKYPDLAIDWEIVLVTRKAV